MTQHFYKAFALGEEETTISSVDAEGIALEGIKALITEDRGLRAVLDLIKPALCNR